jgi:hypothetical protein
MKAREWTASALAIESGLDRRTVNERLEDVQPVRAKKDRRGQVTRYYRGRDAFPALFAGVEAQPASKPRDRELEVDAADRLKFLRAEEIELDLAERRGELVQAASVQAAFDAVLVEEGVRLGAIPQAVSDELVGKDRDTIARVLERVIDGARELYANLRIPLAGASSGARTERREDPAAASASNGSGLGGSEPHSLA